MAVAALREATATQTTRRLVKGPPQSCYGLSHVSPRPGLVPVAIWKVWLAFPLRTARLVVGSYNRVRTRGVDGDAGVWLLLIRMT